MEKSIIKEETWTDVRCPKDNKLFFTCDSETRGSVQIVCKKCHSKFEVIFEANKIIVREISAE